jgi:hypothetical protein
VNDIVLSMLSLTLAYALQVLDGQHANVHEAVHAVREARLLALVQLTVLERTSDALLEARLCQVVGFCPRGKSLVRSGHNNNKK